MFSSMFKKKHHLHLTPPVQRNLLTSKLIFFNDINMVIRTLSLSLIFSMNFVSLLNILELKHKKTF
jgi:hypothetical protein